MYHQQAFIKHLKNYRKVNHLTQNELAELLTYSPKSIDNWEKGLAMPPIDILIDLAHRMKISLDQLLGQDETSIYEQTCHYMLKKHHDNKKPLPPLTNDRLVSYIFKSLIFRLSKKPTLHQGTLTTHAQYTIYEAEIIKYLERNHYLTTKPKYKLGPVIFEECFLRYDRYLKDAIYNTTITLKDKTQPRTTYLTKKNDLNILKKQLADLNTIRRIYYKKH